MRYVLSIAKKEEPNGPSEENSPSRLAHVSPISILPPSGSHTSVTDLGEEHHSPDTWSTVPETEADPALSFPLYEGIPCHSLPPPPHPGETNVRSASLNLAKALRDQMQGSVTTFALSLGLALLTFFSLIGISGPAAVFAMLFLILATYTLVPENYWPQRTLPSRITGVSPSQSQLAFPIASAEMDAQTFIAQFESTDQSCTRPFISCSLMGVLEVPALIDTGSSVSVMSMAALRDLEARLGCTLPVSASTTTLVGFTNQTTPSCKSILLNLTIMNEEKNKLLKVEALCVFVVPTLSSRFILGTNVLKKFQSSYSYGSRGELSFTFRAFPNFGPVPILQLDSETQLLESKQDILLHPGDRAICEVRLLSTPHPTSWERKPLLALSNEPGVKSSEVIRLEDGRSKIFLHNVSNLSVFIPRRDTKIRVAPIEGIDLSHYTPVASVEINMAKGCPCALQAGFTLVFLTCPYGLTYAGRNPDLRKWRKSATPGFLYDKGVYFLQSVPMADTEEAREELKGKGRIAIIAAEALMVTPQLTHFIKSLAPSLVRVHIVQECELCDDCSSRTLISLLAFPRVRSIKKVNIVVPSRFRIYKNDRTLKRLLTGKPDTYRLFTLGALQVHFHITSEGEGAFFLHLSGAPSSRGESLTLGFSELKRVFPSSVVAVYTNAPFKHEDRLGLVDSFKETRHLVHFDCISQKIKVTRNNSPGELREITLSDCLCNFCHNASDYNQYKFYIAANEVWPSLSPEEALARFSSPEELEALRHITSISHEQNQFPNDGHPPDSRDVLPPGSETRESTPGDAPGLQPDTPPSLITATTERGTADEKCAADEKCGADECYASVLLKEVPDEKTTGPFFKEGLAACSQMPLPKENRSVLTIQEIDSKFNLKDSEGPPELISALRLLLFCFRDVFVVDKEVDFVYIKNVVAKLFIKPEYRNKSFHSRPYNLSEGLRGVLAFHIDQAFACGRWLALATGEECLHSFPIFLVDKNSLIKLKNITNEASDTLAKRTSPLDPSAYRLVVDASRQLEVLVDSVNASTIRPLTKQIIEEHLQDDLCSEGEDGIVSALDIANAFDRLLLRAEDRKYQGLALPAGYPTAVSVPVIQGSPVSPALFNMCLDRALSTCTRRVALTFLDDILLNSKITKVPQAYVTPPHKSQLPSLPENFLSSATTFHPHDPGALQKVLAQLDPEEWLPHDLIITSYFAPSSPINKGQDWSTIFNDKETYGNKNSKWTPEQIKNHLKNLALVLLELRASGIPLSASKCSYARTTLNYFGATWTTRTVSIMKERKATLAHFRDITTTKDARRFAGVINFLAPFISSLSYKMRALHASLKAPDDAPLTPAQIRVANKIIDEVESCPPLPLLPADCSAIVVSDASLMAAGLAWGYLDTKKHFIICGYHSTAFSASEIRNTSAIGKEFLALANFLTTYPEIIYRPKPTVCVTDSRGLALLMNAEHTLPMSSKLGRTLAALKSLPLRIRVRHRPSTDPLIRIADVLSRGYNFSWFVEQSVSRKKIKMILSERREKSPPFNIDPADTIPAHLADEDFPIDELELLRDQFHAGNLAKLKRDQGLEYSEIQEQIENVQFSSKRFPDEEEYPELPPKESSTSVPVVAHVHALINGTTSSIIEAHVASAHASSTEHTRSVLQNFSSLTKDKIEELILKATTKNYYNPAQLQQRQLADENFRPIIDGLMKGTSHKKKYQLLNNQLLAKKTKKTSLGYKICLDRLTALTLLAAAHVPDHGSMDTAEGMIGRLFHVKQLRLLTEIVIGSCTVCSLSKPKSKENPGRIKRGKRPFDRVAVDHIKLPPTTINGRVYSYLLTIACTFAKYIVVVPTVSTGAREACHAIDQVLRTIPKPATIISDRGAAFTSHEYREHLRRLGINAITHLPFIERSHYCERFNLIVVNVLRSLLIMNKSRDWGAQVTRLNFLLKKVPQSYTVYEAGKISIKKMSAESLCLGSKPIPLDQALHECAPKNLDLSAFQKARSELLEKIKEANDHLQKIQDKRDKQFASRSKLRVGDLVLKRRDPRRKHSARFMRQIYKVKAINQREIIIQASSDKSKFENVHLDRVKLLGRGELKELPLELQVALGGDPRRNRAFFEASTAPSRRKFPPLFDEESTSAPQSMVSESTDTTTTDKEGKIPDRQPTQPEGGNRIVPLPPTPPTPPQVPALQPEPPPTPPTLPTPPPPVQQRPPRRARLDIRALASRILNPTDRPKRKKTKPKRLIEEI